MNALNGYVIDTLGLFTINPEPACLLMSKNEKFRTDDEIWAAFKAGDEQSYEYMYKQNYNLLLNYGLKFNSNEEDVKDYIQQLFAGLWESKSRLGKNNSIKSYLLSSLRRMILRGSKSRYKFLDLNSISNSFHLGLTTENRFIKNEKEREQINYLSKLIENLPKRQKEAVYLKYFGENSISEISEIMNISAGVVYKLIYKALNNLYLQIGKNKRSSEFL